jgi:hypothetical protein
VALSHGANAESAILAAPQEDDGRSAERQNGFAVDELSDVADPAAQGAHEQLAIELATAVHALTHANPCVRHDPSPPRYVLPLAVALQSLSDDDVVAGID